MKVDNRCHLILVYLRFGPAAQKQMLNISTEALLTVSQSNLPHLLLPSGYTSVFTYLITSSALSFSPIHPSQGQSTCNWVCPCGKTIQARKILNGWYFVYMSERMSVSLNWDRLCIVCEKRGKSRGERRQQKQLRWRWSGPLLKRFTHRQETLQCVINVCETVFAPNRWYLWLCYLYHLGDVLSKTISEWKVHLLKRKKKTCFMIPDGK